MTTRQYWINTTLKIAKPVFTALSQDNLRATQPVETWSDSRKNSPGINMDGQGQSKGFPRDRKIFTHLETVGRTLEGIAPWLELQDVNKEEKELQQEMIQLVLTGLKNAVDPRAQDFLNFNHGQQPVVDASFLAQGLLRSWNSIWLKLDSQTQKRMISCMESSRVIKPGFNNWLLFSAMIEAFLCKASDGKAETWDKMRIDFALKQHEQWYKGDGIYGDGPDFHWDYYNSFVIQPYIYDILHAHPAITSEWNYAVDPFLARLRRYASVQERLISPEGTFPPIGRSLTYRFGAFQVLAQVSLKGLLEENVSPAGVRCALTAVMKRMMNAPGMFDKEGWLRPGFYGYQPSMGERYICTGSLYLCCAVFLPLGLSESDPFWADEDRDWTSRRIWNGEDVPCDHALK